MENGNRGDSNQLTREYFDQFMVEMRQIDADLPSTKLTLYGETFDSPIMTAALSHLNSTCENGMVEMAMGAKMANVVHWCGMGEDEELEAICKTGARTIKIIKPHKDNQVIYHKIRQAESCGAFAVGMDIDHAFNMQGGYDVVCGLEMRPKSFEELKEFIASTKLRFIIKGVLSEQDALKCLEAGAKGIVVSHHHGIMNSCVPPLMILPKIAKVIDGRIPIFVDCCFESGMDVFKALALGATAVSIGRATMEPLKQGGAAAVCNYLKRTNAELSSIMARTGFHNLEEVDDSVIWNRNGGR